MLNNIALLAIAGYLGAVALHGNIKPLGSDLVQDKGYLKWLLAVAIIIAIQKNPSTQEIGDPLLFAVLLALLYKVVNTSGLTGSLTNAINNL